ncbi:MAG TPA: hypothetical protein VGJ81_16555 [Thermoanaerobaculia bacterium]
MFVNETLVATPSDFGFYGKDEPQTGGLFAPLQTEMSHERFRHNLTAAIEKELTVHH